MIEAKALIVSGRVLARPGWEAALAGARQAVPSLRAIIVADESEAPSWAGHLTTFAEAIRAEEYPLSPRDCDAPALLLSTGGTTGPSKVVVHCENAIVFAAREYARQCGFSPADTMLAPGPYGHASGSIFALHAPVIAGSRILPLTSWSAVACAEAVQRHQATWAMMSGTHIYDLLARYPDGTSPLSSLRGLSAGSGADALYAAAEARFGVVVRRMYGLTECLGHALMPAAAEPSVRISRDGLAFPFTENRVVTPGTTETVEAGTTGEYLVRGPSLFMGYLGRDDLTAAALTADGFLRTGDLMNLDGHGFVKYVGRIKDVIRRGGVNIDPMPIERVLVEHPALNDASIVGVPNERLGEIAAAVVVPGRGQSVELADVTRFLLERGVAKQSLPEVLLVWDELPKTEFGKHNKVAIRQRIADVEA